MKFIRPAFLFGLSLLASVVVGQPLRERLDALLVDAPVTKRTTITLKVADLTSGEVLYDRGGGVLMTPASNLKIYTSSSALDIFGPEHRFTTRVGYTGTLTDGVLRGDLVLIGGGDPMMTSAELQSLAAKLVTEHGIREVTGGVLIDDSLFNIRLKGPGWMWDDDPDDYNMSISSFMVDFNVLKVTVAPGADGAAPTVTMTPPSDYPPLSSEVDPTAQRPAVTRTPFTHPILVRLPSVALAESTTTELTMHDPLQWTAGVFRAAFAAAGGRIGPGTLVSRNPIVTTPLLSHRSRPLAELVHDFNKTSRNSTGELLLLHLGGLTTGQPGTWDSGATAISEWLTSKAGLEVGSFRLVDGSGLSRYNLITADSSVRLAQFMWTHPHKQPFFDSLPVYKVALPVGTPETTSTERVHAKPGGMGSVATISGYIETLDGRWLAFSWLANGYIGSNAPISELRGKVYTELVKPLE